MDHRQSGQAHSWLIDTVYSSLFATGKTGCRRVVKMVLSGNDLDVCSHMPQQPYLSGISSYIPLNQFRCAKPVTVP
jgi:hypothetical protein